MSVYLNNKEKYVIKILNNIDEINNILKENSYFLKSYKYDLEIYMVNKNENFAKIKKIEDIKDYAIIKDENGIRKVILKNKVNNEAKIYSIFLTHDLLYNLGYYKLFYINKDIYSYEKQCDERRYFYFEILDIKEQGCFLEIETPTLKDLENFISNFKKIGINVDNKNLKVDNIQQELSKVLFKKK